MDAVTWCLSTEVDEQRKGPQLELALGGVARDLVREISVEIKLNGGTVVTDQGMQDLTGAVYILHVLSTRFMPLPEEVNLHSLADLHGFQRMPGEPIDTMLTRFEIIVQRARQRADIPLHTQHTA